jgi:nitrogen regulatory protein P-II 1
MKKIEAIVRPFKLEDVRIALAKIGVNGMTITEVRGLGNQKGHMEIYRGNEYPVDFLTKIKVEVVVPEELLDSCLDAIMTSARTGVLGDGRVFISTIDQVLRIRTGEEDADAW